MIKCVYTTQKHKKLKKWLDGFIQMKGKKLLLYDADKTNIFCTISVALDNDMETAGYLIYAESLEDEEEPKRCKVDGMGSERGRTDEEMFELFR